MHTRTPWLGPARLPFLRLTPACLALGLAVPSTRDVLRPAQNLPQLLPAMGRQVALTLLTPLLMASGMLML